MLESIDKFEKNFRKLTLRDQRWVERLCWKDDGISGHIHFPTMYLCQDMYGDYFRKYKKCIVKKPYEQEGKLFFQYPIGSRKDRLKAIRQVSKLYGQKYNYMVLFGASEKNVIECKKC